MCLSAVTQQCLKAALLNTDLVDGPGLTTVRRRQFGPRGLVQGERISERGVRCSQLDGSVRVRWTQLVTF